MVPCVEVRGRILVGGVVEVLQMCRESNGITVNGCLIIGVDFVG